MKRQILLLGDSRLRQVCSAVTAAEATAMRAVIEDLHDTLLCYAGTYGAGRAIAAPQIGVMKRLIYMYIDKPWVFINPELSTMDEEKIEVLDDCMSFPGLFVVLQRFKRCKLRYRDENWVQRELTLEDDLSELIQHEYDHLDGILAVDRALSSHDLIMKTALVPAKEDV